MKHLGVLCMIIILAATSVFAGGKEVTLNLRSGDEFEAELIAVTDNELLIAREEGLSTEELTKNPAMVERVPMENLVKVTVEGKSYVLLGGGLGFVGGIVVGGLIGASQTPDPQDPTGLFGLGNSAAGALFGAVGGTLLGLIIGGAASDAEVTYAPASPSELVNLKKYARFPGEVPDFLQQPSP